MGQHKSKKNDCNTAAQAQVTSAPPPPLGSRLNPYDFVIVGLGTAGAPLARYLSEDLKTTVGVIEAGEDRSDPVDNPGISGPGSGALFGDPTLANDPRYSFNRLVDPADINVGLAGTASYSDGRLWGGGSGHNGIQAVRSTPDVYDNWGVIDPQWNYNNLLPVMIFLETYTPNGTVANPTQRGDAGPLFISQDPPLAANHFYSDAVIATNTPQIDDYNDPDQGDVGIVSAQRYATPDTPPVRSWSQSAFLPPSILATTATGGAGTGGRKLTVTSRSTATELIIDSSGSTPKAIGVRYVTKGDAKEALKEVFAKKKVILCAGTIANAALLQVSGIGPAALLNSLDIPVVVANDNVGINVQNHYGPTALIQQDAGSPIPFQAGQFYVDLSGNVVGGYNLGAADGVRRFQIYTLPVNAFIPNAILTALGIEGIPAVSLLGFNMIPNRLGTIEINSKDALTAPTVKFHYYQDTFDMDNTVKMYKLAANVAQQYGTTVLYPPNAHYPAPYGGQPALDNSKLIQDAKDVTLIAAYHAVGSCRMAPTAATGVVDGDLNVFGITGLSCCDCSVIPDITKGNTAYPAYILGLQKAKIEGATVPY